MYETPEPLWANLISVNRKRQAFQSDLEKSVSLRVDQRINDSLKRVEAVTMVEGTVKTS